MYINKLFNYIKITSYYKKSKNNYNVTRAQLELRIGLELRDMVSIKL